ncbi:gephyrin-like molybdotransferase receptor GlpR [Streptomyces sp. 142MFCol3.1]|uniref:divisome protein SepX/GlpR n=1 Tax=Streptomyces sp. 142MFCol3.1 TaxID=1172179 RepID=UPI0003F71EEC|nr:gephyrin-like molybdotransferase receptor GlpR [Streptomyces sp. 142MFCol3.1]
MSSSGLIYAVIVGAWAAYLVPMWLRRQDELNEARPTERFSTAIRLLSGRAGMERRYAKDLRARSADQGESSADPGDVTDSVDVRAFAAPPSRTQAHAENRPQVQERVQSQAPAQAEQKPAARPAARPGGAAQEAPGATRPVPRQPGKPAPQSAPPSATGRPPGARRAPSAEAAARARRTKVLARRRRTTVLLFLAFTLGAIVAAVGGLAFLWAPGVPAMLLSGYIVYLRAQERRRFTYTMDRRRAEAAAQRLRERQPRRRPALDEGVDEPEEGPATDTDTGLSALAADRRALVEQTDHAEWVDQQRERQRGPGQGDSWDPVPVPLPTYVTAPVAPRATSSVDLGAPDAWSSARSSAAEPAVPESAPVAEEAPDGTEGADDGRSDARRAASARRARERGRTPLFDQYEDGERPRAANE